MAATARFLVVFLVGLVAAASIGKLVPYIDWMAANYGISLAASGFLVSAVMLPGALLGPVLGLVADRCGAKRVALGGLGLQAAASLAGAHADAFAVLLALRFAEGVGYSLAIVAATMLVIEGASEKRQTMALAVWSAFAPVGFALGQLFAGSVAEANPLPLIGGAHALFLGACALLLAVSVSGAGGRASDATPAQFLATLRHAPALLTALAFGCATGVLLGAVALAPLVLAPNSGLSVAATAQLTALAALPGILGRFASGWLLGGAARPIAIVIGAGAAGCALLLGALAAPWPLALALACFAGFQICVGVLPGVMSAMLPWVAPSAGRLGTVSGLANQMITAGNLVAPPMILGVYAFAGTAGALIVLVAAVALSAALVSGVGVYHKPIGPL